MAFRIGRCTNDLFCSFASAQQDLQVPADGNFVCPQCGKALSNPPARSGGGAFRLAIVAGGSLAMAGVLLFLAGMMMGSRHSEPQMRAQGGPQGGAVAGLAAKSQLPTPAAAAPTGVAAPQVTPATATGTPSPSQAAGEAPAQTATAQTAIAAPAQDEPAHALPAAAAVSEPPAGLPATPPAATHTALIAGPARAPTVQLAMVQQPGPARAAPLQGVAPAPRPDADQVRRAQAQAEQVKRAQAEQAKRAQAEQAKRIQAEQAKRAQAEQAKRAEALAEETKRAQAEAEQTRQAEEIAAKKRADELAEARRERAQQLETQRAAAQPQAVPAAPQAAPPVVVATLQPPAPKPAPAPVPSGPTRGFSTRPVAGGSPAYPSELESDDRSGSVTVSCHIQADGRPAGCRAVSARGGEPFKGAVLGWLNSGRVRYEPILRNGKPVAETHEWTVQFQPD